MIKHVTAVLSMLHETSGRHSAARTFRDEPVLAWTLERLSRAKRLGDMAIVCWEDQLEAVTPIAEETSAYVLSKDPRIIVPAVESVTAARNWSEGWRGGLLGTCDFDLGFYAPWVREIVEHLNSDAVILVDPAAGLVDPALIDRLIERANEHESLQICFSQAAPGLAGVLIRPTLLDQLAAARQHPGRILGYLPDQPVRDPIGGDGCLPVPAAIARTTRSFKLDSDRQIARITEAAINLNGELLASDAEGLVHRLEWPVRGDPLPREIVVELTPRRLSRPVYSPVAHQPIERPEMSLDLARKVFAELAVADDARVTFGGVGDPLAQPKFDQFIDAAKSAGIRALHVETDLLNTDTAAIERLADPRIDVVSVHVPAMTRETYQAVMSVDGFTTALENVRRLVKRRHELQRGVPLIVPVFTKCQQNLGEMEAWYDQWLGALGCAVIVGPSDFAGLIPDCAVADMSPPTRSGCGRIHARMTILSDGRAATCEQDVLGRQTAGDMRFDSLAVVWNDGMQALRQAHRGGNLAAHPLCVRCREWHRP